MKGAFILLLAIGLAAAWNYEMDFQECDDMYDDFSNRCMYEPCEWSSCSMNGMSCRNNFCGGCHARWYDNDGNYYHSCSNYFMWW